MLLKFCVFLDIKAICLCGYFVVSSYFYIQPWTAEEKYINIIFTKTD